MKDAIFTWVLPTEREEGGPLLPEDIAHVQLELSADGGANWTELAPVPPTQLTQAANNLIIAEWLVRGFVEDKLGQRSRNPQETAFSVVDDSPPGGITVQVSLS